MNAPRTARLPRRALELAFPAKARHFRVHDQHGVGDDEDEDKDQPADRWMAVARRGVQKLVTF
jgi:hypothetical protein